MTDQSKEPSWDPLALSVQLQNIAKQSQMLLQRVVSSQEAWHG
jgi:poly[(R)-3-hydroxyalkanoate] polymerase subunit PhaC